MIMTDHLIQRRPPPGDLLAEFHERPPDYQGEIVPYYPSPLPRTRENTLYLAVAQVGLGNNTEAGLPVLAREIAAQKPEESEFYQILGEAWMNAGKPREARAAYERAAQLNPKSTRAFRDLASALSAIGEGPPAGEMLRRALAIAPGDPITWYRAGLREFTDGNFAGAEQKLRKAIELDPYLPDQSRNLAEVLVKAGKIDGAQAALRDALRTDPYDDAAWDLGGRILTEKGQMPDAFFHFEKAVRLRPAFGPYLYDYALALVRADRFDEAQGRVEEALRADPSLPDAHELLGGLFVRKRQLAEAASEYRRTLELQPASSRAHLRLGNVLAAQGDVRAASEHLREAAKSSDAAIARQAVQALSEIGAR